MPSPVSSFLILYFEAEEGERERIRIKFCHACMVKGNSPQRQMEEERASPFVITKLAFSFENLFLSHFERDHKIEMMTTSVIFNLRPRDESDIVIARVSCVIFELFLKSFPWKTQNTSQGNMRRDSPSFQSSFSSLGTLRFPLSPTRHTRP